VVLWQALEFFSKAYGTIDFVRLAPFPDLGSVISSVWFHHMKKMMGTITSQNLKV